jgi:hypothetical protein
MTPGAKIRVMRIAVAALGAESSFINWPTFSRDGVVIFRPRVCVFYVS